MSKRLEAIKSSRGFYREGYHRICKLLLTAVCLILVFSVMLIVICFRLPDPAFYKTDRNGDLVRLVPLDAPNYAQKPLID